MVDSDVEFIMNGTNHLNKSIVSYPFAIFENIGKTQCNVNNIQINKIQKSKKYV
jgi:hypothetical protein